MTYGTPDMDPNLFNEKFKQAFEEEILGDEYKAIDEETKQIVAGLGTYESYMSGLIYFGGGSPVKETKSLSESFEKFIAGEMQELDWNNRVAPKNDLKYGFDYRQVNSQMASVQLDK